MSESNSTRTFRDHLVSKGAHVQRVEDKLTPGIPDTNASMFGVDFWAEGKHLTELPVRLNTQVVFGKKGEPRLIHQCNWLTARHNAGGLCFWWLRVRDGDGAGWYLFADVDEFVWLRDGLPKQWLLDHPNRFSTCKEMVDCIESTLVSERRVDV